nr:unnamed protein product [Digitaria exilis]
MVAGAWWWSRLVGPGWGRGEHINGGQWLGAAPGLWRLPQEGGAPWRLARRGRVGQEEPEI